VSRRIATQSLAVLVMLFMCACRAEPPQPLAADTAAVAASPAVLPDISGAAPEVQAQLRQQYSSLQDTISSRRAPNERADAYGAMGRLLIATEFFDAAAACFSNARLLQPSDMRWPYYLAHVERLRNEPAKAAALFEQTLSMQPDHVPSLVWLGAMRLVTGDAADAEMPLAKALDLQPHDAAALYHNGRVALAKHDYQRAIERLNAALAADPQASSIHYSLSLAYRGAGDMRNAEAQLRLRGNTDPAPADPLMQQVSGLLQNASAFEVRAAEALGKRQWPAAIAALRQALQLAPNNAFTHLNLGTALFQTGDASGALTEFREAVRLSPELAKAHYGIGIVTEAAGREADALDAFAAAVKADPEYAEARLSFGDALRRNGRDADALPQYAAVIKVNPSASPAYFGYAMALVHLKRWTEARDALGRAATTFTDQPGFAHALARVLASAPDASARDGGRALAIVDTLLKNQRTLELMQTMAMALAEVGRFDEAVVWQRGALDAAAQSNRPDLSARLAENLSRYEKRLPCRTPWPDDDPVFRPRPSR
jgi:tetratricopeptide (TPR) repeat protein